MLLVVVSTATSTMMMATSPTSVTTTSASHSPSASEPLHKYSMDEPSDPLLPVHGVGHRKESISATFTSSSLSSAHRGILREGVLQEIPRLVVRQKLQKCRHLVLPQTIRPEYLDSLFPQLVKQFEPQMVQYNGGIANVTQWKISCYLEVMKGGIPCTNPHLPLLELFRPLLDVCNDLFLAWYRQQHACNASHRTKISIPHRTCQRLMTFITRYTPAPGEQALLKHIDGAGKVAGSIVVSLPIDRWSGSEEENSFVGHGGGLTFWDGRQTSSSPPQDDSPSTVTCNHHQKRQPREIHYDTRSGDVAFIDRAVWHQADPITKGTRWALVIFYDVQEGDEEDESI